MADGISWGIIGEIIKVVGAIVTAGAAFTGAFIAWRGLEKWRAETTGKRQAELAATVLADFYEFEEIIRLARSPFVHVYETAPKEGISDKITSDSSFAPERRLIDHQEFFARFRSRKHEFSAVFGRHAAKPFDDAWKIRLEINQAVDGLLHHKDLRNDRDTENNELWREWYRTAFRQAEDDSIAQRLKTVLEDIERICRPAIDARPV